MFPPTPRSLRTAAVAALPVLLSACTLVGYPGGTPGTPVTGAYPATTTSPAPRTSGAPRVLGPTEGYTGSRRSDAGRTYEVFGEEYRVLSSAHGYEAEGLASWYGEKFHGRPTASGETFDMYGFTAAHRTLPLHTWVEVTNLVNGRAVVLRVNDRGPFAHTGERILDLSYGAARELDVVAAGTARVRVRALSPDEVAALN